MPVTSPSHSRSVLVAVAALVLVALVVAAVLSGSGGGKAEDPGSPEATVQAYFEALVDGRRSDARATFTDELAARCPEVTDIGFSRPPRVVITGSTLDGAETVVTDIGFSRPSRVVITGSRLDGAETVVDVRITMRGSDAVLVGSDDTFGEQVRLVETPQGWRISDSPWPYVCAMKVIR